MSDKQNIAYGKWPSPLDVAYMSKAPGYTDVSWDTKGHILYWHQKKSKRSEVIGYDFARQKYFSMSDDIKVSGRVGYGGGSFTAGRKSAFFIGGLGGRIYKSTVDERIANPLTIPHGDVASLAVSPCGKWLSYVHQDVDDNNKIAIVSTEEDQWPQIFTSGYDFYTQPRFSPCGNFFTAVAWNHPHMPWDSSHLLLGEVSCEGTHPVLKNIIEVSSSDNPQAVFQPEFSKKGEKLFFMKDSGGKGDLYSYDIASKEVKQVSFLEGDSARPNWIQEMRSYALSSDGKFAFVATIQNAITKIYKVDLNSCEDELLSKLGFMTSCNQLACSPRGSKLAFIGSSPKHSPEVVIYDYKTSEVTMTSTLLGERKITSEHSSAESVTWRGHCGDIYGIFWPALSDKYIGPKEEKSPLLIKIHGGPTTQSLHEWNPEAQFYTSRGFSVLYLNYRGSTGYGREYMEKLNGQWGVAEVDDAHSSISYLAKHKGIDAKRVFIMGTSAGGYTVLQSLIKYPSAFKGGVSAYGICDLIGLSETTHKFEKHYNDVLIAPLPEGIDLYKKRSPIFYTDKIESPVLLFHGSKDKVVPVNQALMFVNSLKEKNKEYEFHLYEGEGHGFRKSENKEHYYQTMLKFFQSLL